MRLPADRVAVVPIAVPCGQDPKGIEYREPAKEFNFGVLSRLTPEKGVEDVVRAFRLISEDVECRLKIFGSGRAEERLLALVNELGLERLVSFEGYVPASIAFPQIQCGVLASYGEGLPRSIIEGGCYGVPFIATRVGGIPEVVKDAETGWLFEAGDIEGLSRLMRRVALDRENTANVGRNIRSLTVAEFSPQVEASRLADSIKA